VPGSGRRTVASVGPLLVLLLLAPLAGAQPSPPAATSEGGAYDFKLSASQGSVTVDYLRSKTLDLVVEDVSTTSDGGSTQAPSRMDLDVEVVGDKPGWQATVAPSNFNIKPGETRTLSFTIGSTALIEEPSATIRVTATYETPDNRELVKNLTVLAVANPNPIVTVQGGSLPDDFRPDEQKRIDVVVRNQDYYPHMVQFTTRGPEGWVVSPPSSIQMAPGETRTVQVDVKAPQDPWFRLNPSSDGIQVAAEAADGGPQQQITVPVSASGFFLPAWVIPHITLLVIGLAVIGRGMAQRVRERRLEAGKPTFPGLPPEKEARFRALSVAEPDRAEEMRERLKQHWSKRREAWKDWHRERRKRARERRSELRGERAAILAAREEDDRSGEDDERRRQRREELLERKRELERQREQERREQEDELAEELRDQRERRQDEEG